MNHFLQRKDRKKIQHRKKILSNRRKSVFLKSETQAAPIGGNACIHLKTNKENRIINF